MSEARPFSRLRFHGTVEDLLPDDEFRSLARQFCATEATERAPSLIVARASELLHPQGPTLPDWADAKTRYLVVLDVPEQAALRLASILRIHKPHQRLHVCRDPQVVKRLVIALKRPSPWEGILDAYLLQDTLVVVLGDMSVREFPTDQLPRVRRLASSALKRFRIDSAGSCLSWPDAEVHMGPSQMLQAVDPPHRAKVEMRRYEMENVSQVLFDMRNHRRLRQTDIPGLSERHVRRLENEEVRLTVGAATKLAGAMELTLSDFLDELSRRITARRNPVPKNQGGHVQAA